MKERAHNLRQNTGILTERQKTERLPARAEMLARGRKLLEDPDYPDITVVRALAKELMPLLY